MSIQVLYSKTAKGVAELSKKAPALSRAAQYVLSVVDGQSGYKQLLEKCNRIPADEFKTAINELMGQGMIRALVNSAPIVAEASDDSEITVAELDPEEGVRAWAEATRCAQSLKQVGFYTAPSRRKNQALILVVEDSIAVAQLEMTLLGQAGFTTQHAETGAAAMQFLAANTPDLVILDVNLPDTTGFEILATLRKHERFSKLPIVMVTTQAGEDDVLAGIRGGADGYIFKPFQHEALISCVRQVLDLE